MTTAKLVFDIRNPGEVVTDLDSAVPVASRMVALVEPAAPEPLWRVNPRAPKMPASHLAELVHPNETTLPDDSYFWYLLSGEPPRFVELKLTVEMDPVITFGAVRMDFVDEAEFALLGGGVYEAVIREPGVHRVYMHDGGELVLRQMGPEGNLPIIGWRNRIRIYDELPNLELPDWVDATFEAPYLDLTLGPSPFDLDPADAVLVRDRLVEAGILSGPRQR